MIQKIAQAIGEFGCYYLCILKLFNRENEALSLYTYFTQAKIMKPDCFINFPDKMAKHLSGQTWTVTHEPADYVAKPGEKEVHRYEWGKLSHFVLPDWDPLQDSNTRKNGRLVSKRIFRRA